MTRFLVRLRRLLLSAGALVNVTASSFPQQSVSLQEAIALARQNSRTLKISQVKEVAALAKAHEASTALLPNLRLTAGYQRQSDVGPFQVTVPFLPRALEIAPSIVNTYTTRVSVQQPLFTGLRLLNNADAAEYLGDAARYDRLNEEAELTLAVTTAYWMLYQAMQVRTFADENMARLQAMEQDTRNLLKAGLATRNDLLKVQLQLNAARLSQIDAANEVRVAMMNLNVLMGQRTDTQLELTSRPLVPAHQEGKVFRPDDAAPEVSALLERAMQSRADIRAMSARLEAARAAARAARGAWWPQVYLVGGYSYARPNLRFQPTRDEFKGSWDLGIQLQFDVWNWNATADQVAQTDAFVTQTELALAQLQERVALDLKRQWLALQRAEEKVRVAFLAIEQAEENQRTMNDRYRQGIASSTELLDANVALLQARTSYSAALVEYELAAAQLRRSGGETSAP